jgi:hypothetical protein
VQKVACLACSLFRVPNEYYFIFQTCFFLSFFLSFFFSYSTALVPIYYSTFLPSSSSSSSDIVGHNSSRLRRETGVPDSSPDEAGSLGAVSTRVFWSRFHARDRARDCAKLIVRCNFASIWHNNASICTADYSIARTKTRAKT